MTTPPPGPGPAAVQPPHHRAWWSWRRWVLAVAAVGLLAAAVLAEGPLLRESLHSFTHLQYMEMFWAVVAEIVSMVSLGLMERRILMLAGLGLSAGRAISIAYASNALSESLPIVGSVRPPRSATGGWCRRRRAGPGRLGAHPGGHHVQHRLRPDHLLSAASSPATSSRRGRRGRDGAVGAVVAVSVIAVRRPRSGNGSGGS